MVNTLLTSLLIVVPVLVNVAFFTLMERKILGLMQSRKGPNKVSLMGVLQPISDAIKLFAKEHSSLLMASAVFMLAPVGALTVILVLWQTLPAATKAGPLEHSSILLIMVMGLSLYPLLLAGWASNSKYSLVGALRGVAQAISYEISLALILLSAFLPLVSSSLSSWEEGQVGLMWAWGGPVLMLWMISAIAETNRTPFDFAEGESELVSGFNTEYGAGGFAIIFMAEYGSIMFLSCLSGVIIFGGSLASVEVIFFSIFLMYFWVWVRATLPRFRYDILMAMAWKMILPATLVVLYLSASL